ncbi:tyrosine-type recombinase/integrase [Ralstonia solanacearum]|uniref:tyrosine-type recombinase/integrase n=1 Tax=Ralstonia solanacearum TaxID=305 RepID=UPI001FF97FD7
MNHIKPPALAAPANALASPVLPAGADDAELVRRWLAAKLAAGLGIRPNTASQYALEGRRLLWFAHATDRRLQAWGLADAQAYLRLLRAPPPAAIGATRSQDSAAWRPLRGPLSEASARQSALIAGSFFNWLVGVQAIRVNPFSALPRSRRPRGPGSQHHFLELDHLRAVFEAIAARPTPTFWDRIQAARDRLVIALAFQTGLRASELAALVWGDFERRQGRHGPYWVIVVRHAKGGDDQVVPCGSAMEELARFRRLLGLSPEPRLTDGTAVIPAMPGGKRRATTPHDSLTLQRPLARPVATRQGLYGIVRRAFGDAADQLTQRGDVELADKLQQASTHWLRHTTATHMLRATGSLTDVQALLRHRDINTSRTYAHDALEDVAAAVAGVLQIPG